MFEYKKLVENIMTKLDNGDLKVGQKVDSVRKLCADNSISTQTSYRALRELAEMGIIESRRGQGFYVISTQKVERPTTISSAYGRVIVFYSRDLEFILNVKDGNSSMFSSIQTECNNNRLKFEVVKFPEGQDQIDFIRHFIDDNKDITGVLLFRLNTIEETQNVMLLLKSKNIPVISMCEFMRSEGKGISSVGFDYSGAGNLATDLLLDEGVNKMISVGAYIGEANPQFYCIENARISWMSNGKNPDNFLVNTTTVNCHPLRGYKATRDLFEKHPDIEGVLYTHHGLAEGGCSYIKEYEEAHNRKIYVVAITQLEINIIKWEHDIKLLLFPYSNIGKFGVNTLIQEIKANSKVQRYRILPYVKDIKV